MVHDDTPSSRNSLWMGDLEPWMDEAYLRQLWFSLGCNVRFWRLDTPKNFVLGSNTSSFLFFFFFVSLLSSPLTGRGQARKK